MVILIGVALVSAAGWLISLGYPRSAARRHLVLSMTLALCYLLPIGVGVRSGTNWTLLAIRTSPSGCNAEASAKAPPMSVSSIERSVALRDAAEFRGAHSTDARPAQEISGEATIKEAHNSSSGQQNVSSSEAGVTAPGSPKPAPGSKGDATSWRTLAMRW